MKDNPDAVHIFLRASMEYKCKRANSFYGIPAPEAEGKVSRQNGLRRDHYTYYTGQIWGDPENYAAVFDTSRLGEDAIVKAVVDMVRSFGG